jgi:hypothetical protein
MGNSTLTDPERNYYMVFFFSARKDEQRKYEESSTKEISKVLSYMDLPSVPVSLFQICCV